MKNPFSITFGKSPAAFVPRIRQINQVIETFMDEAPSYQACVISGVRGCGKTVMLSEICHKLQEYDDWIVINLNSGMDLLHAFVSKLYHAQTMTSVFDSASINLSFFGIGVSLSTTPPITDLEVALERMMNVVKKKHKKVLIAIDEVISDGNTRIFANTFQYLLREDYPIFLLMTGLYEEISDLQNDKGVTFLLRTPRLDLEPLNIMMMAERYKDTLGVEEQRALEMARFTKGYPFAFQVLGYLCYESKKEYIQEQTNFDFYLSEYVYDKIWSELSGKDKELAAAICASDYSTKNIMENAGLKKNEFSVYRDRLIKKGLVSGQERGKLTFVLPRFEEYIERNTDI